MMTGMNNPPMSQPARPCRSRARRRAARGGLRAAVLRDAQRCPAGHARGRLQQIGVSRRVQDCLGDAAALRERNTRRDERDDDGERDESVHVDSSLLLSTTTGLTTGRLTTTYWEPVSEPVSQRGFRGAPLQEGAPAPSPAARVGGAASDAGMERRTRQMRGRCRADASPARPGRSAWPRLAETPSSAPSPWRSNARRAISATSRTRAGGSTARACPANPRIPAGDLVEVGELDAVLQVAVLQPRDALPRVVNAAFEQRRERRVEVDHDLLQFAPQVDGPGVPPGARRDRTAGGRSGRRAAWRRRSGRDGTPWARRAGGSGRSGTTRPPGGRARTDRRRARTAGGWPVTDSGSRRACARGRRAPAGRSGPWEWRPSARARPASARSAFPPSGGSRRPASPRPARAPCRCRASCGPRDSRAPASARRVRPPSATADGWSRCRATDSHARCA